MGGVKNYFLRCILCGAEYDPAPMYVCDDCGGLLEVVMDLPSSKFFSRIVDRPWYMWRYRELLPLGSGSRIVSLWEGGTRLFNLSVEDGLSLYIKLEGDNPTGSFKDRGMSLGVSKALEYGFSKVACASTGNTSASMAAYAARAGLEALVFLPRGKVARGKLFQAVAHGARIVEVDGSFDDAFKMVRRHVSESSDLYLLNSINPYRLEGQKTIAYEIYEALSNAPDYVIVPVGNAGNIYAIWKGFFELFEMGVIDDVPRMIGVQASGAAPMVHFFRNGTYRPVEAPETLATAIRIGNPVNRDKAMKAVKFSGGWFSSVSDRDILSAQLDIARRYGLLVEPASAAPYAYFRSNIDLFKGSVVLISTGHGLKDPDILKYWSEYGLI